MIEQRKNLKLCSDQNPWLKLYCWLLKSPVWVSAIPSQLDVTILFLRDRILRETYILGITKLQWFKVGWASLSLHFPLSGAWIVLIRPTVRAIIVFGDYIRRLFTNRHDSLWGYSYQSWRLLLETFILYSLSSLDDFKTWSDVFSKILIRKLKKLLFLSNLSARLYR